MKKKLFIPVFLILAGIVMLLSCSKEYPVDDQGRLITGRAECYMSFFDLLGSDNRTVLVTGATVIDTVNLTVKATARYGTNLTRVKPYCSVVTDAIVEPTMGQWTDFSTSHQYTVVSGNRKVRKTYSVTITLQP